MARGYFLEYISDGPCCVTYACLPLLQPLFHLAIFFCYCDRLQAELSPLDRECVVLSAFQSSASNTSTD